MKSWNGAAAIVMVEDQVLMVKEKESGGWSIPSGGIEVDESPEQACLREVWEETGFRVNILKPLHVKRTIIKNHDVALHYFLCEVTEGQISYHDPDDAIEEIAWKTGRELSGLIHDYPEDRELLLSFFNKNYLLQSSE